MAAELTTESLTELLRASGLVSDEKVGELRRHLPVQTSTVAGFMSLLLSRNLLTQWQADKLKLGKHRGFFLGPYRLQSYLARGGMCSLYIAEHTESKERHALKVLPPSKVGGSSYLPRFLREAELASKLDHKNVMRVHNVLTCAEQGLRYHFMAMELLSGHDLYHHVFSSGPLPAARAAEFIRQAAEGLQYAHDRGLVHRDVKPGNLFLTDSGEIKIVDLGLAAILEGQEESLTRDYDERILGTADYLAPEQAIDSHRVDARADIYGLGCTFYFLLTGRPPFTDGTIAQRILAHQTRDPEPVEHIRRDVPQPIIDTLNAMLVKRRSNRIQSCRDVADRLADWSAQEIDPTAGESVSLVADGDSVRLSRRLRRIRKSDADRESPTDSMSSHESKTVTVPQPAPDQSPDTTDSSDISEFDWSSTAEEFESLSATDGPYRRLRLRVNWNTPEFADNEPR